MKRKLLSVLLVTVMLLTCIPLSAVSVSAETEGDYTYTVTDGEATITGYNGAGGDVITPVTLGGYPVTGIGDWAFSRCTGLTSVIISDSVVSIGRNAFNMCTGLSTVTISDSVATLGIEAFYECTALTSLVLSNSLTVIDQGVFWNCTSLISVTVPKNVTTIGSCAFYGSGLSSITLPVSVSTIAWGAFSGCTNLSDVYYAGVERVRDKITISSNNDALLSAAWHYAEDPAKGLLYEIANDEVTITGYTDDLPVDVVIPGIIEGYPVTMIGDYAFYDCNALYAVVIPNTVTSIGVSAFNKSKVDEVFIPENVRFIADDAFASADQNSFRAYYAGTREEWNVLTEGSGNKILQNCYCNVSFEFGIVYQGETTILSSIGELPSVLVIPDGVTKIANTSCWWGDISFGAFSGCDFTKVILPEGLSYIASGTFFGCTIESIVIPDSVTYIGSGGVSCGPAFEDASVGHVYYSGTEEDRTNIENIDYGGNKPLLNATWHYAADPISDTVTHSVMDTDNGTGLAFRFELSARGVTIAGGVADLTNATVNYLGIDRTLIGMGTVVTNSDTVAENLTLDAVNDYNTINVPTVYMMEVDEDSCAYATRIIDIPADQLERVLYARPYYIVEVNGEQIVVYGNIDSASCAEYM